MWKRSSKVIALVLAGMSSAYAMPVSAKVIELSEKEGDFSNAIAFNNGKYLYDGYKDDNDSAIYYNNGKADTKLEDIDDWDNFKKYSNKYVVDDDEGYKINLDDGTVEDDYVGEDDNNDIVKSKLSTKLSKTQRYGKNVNVEQVENINNNTFTDGIWYSYVAESTDSYESSIFDENTEESELQIQILKRFSSNTKLKIGNKEFVVNGNSEDDINELINQIKHANFTKYKLSNIEKIKLEDDENTELYGVTFSIIARNGYNLPDKENFEEIKYYYGNQWISMDSSEVSIKTKDDIIAEQVKSKIKIEINAFYSDITICGQTFSPAWGSKLVESLEKEIKGATFDGYTVISTVAEQNSSDDNSGKLTIILGSKEELSELPDNLILFGGNKPSWEISASLVNDGSSSGNPSETPGEGNEDDSTESPDNEIKSKIKIEIGAFYGTVTIDGQEFTTDWDNEAGNFDTESLEKKIKEAKFDGYSVISTLLVPGESEGSLGKLIVTLGTKEEMDELPEDLIFFNGNPPNSWEISASLVNDESSSEDPSETPGEGNEDDSTESPDNEIKSKIKIEIGAFYGTVTIDGQEFTTDWDNEAGNFDTESLEKKIKEAKFDGYSVISTLLVPGESEGSLGKLIVTLGTKEEMDELPEDLIFFNGNPPNSWEISASLIEEQEAAISASTDIQEEQSLENNTLEEAESEELILEDEKVADEEEVTNLEDIEDKDIKIDNTVELTTEDTNIETFNNESKLAKEDSEVEDDNQTEHKAKYYGYYNEDGKYIDCSEIANLTIYNGTRIVKFERFNTSKTIDGFTMKIGLPEFVDTLGEDDNYIYSLIKVSILGAKKESDNSDINEPIYYVQKISKVSNGKIDGANLPSSVESYQLDNRGWDGGDNWSYTAAYIRIIDKYINDHDSVKIAFNDGEMYLGLIEDNKLVSVKIKLKRKATGLLEDGTEVFEKMISVDTSNEADEEPFDWTLDKNGNVWSIYKGKIQKSSQGEEFQDVYKVDRTMDRLDVYDENNLVAWSTDTGIYTTVQEGAMESNNIKKTGWQSVDGNWYLYDINGKVTKGWHKVNNSNWYYFNEEGVMQKGWLELDGKTYYLSNSGIMKKGWVKIDSKWYYFNQSGEKQINTTIDGYILNENGEWID